jgi:hypothetical protein
MGEKPKTWAYYMLAVFKSATSIFPGNLRVIALRYPQSPYKTYIYAVFGLTVRAGIPMMSFLKYS